MPLPGKNIAIPFGKGLNQEVAEALVPSGKVSVATQAWVEKQGSIQTRPGTSVLETPVKGRPQWSQSEQCAVFDGFAWLDYDPATDGLLNFEYDEQFAVSFWMQAEVAANAGLVGRRALGVGIGWSISQTDADRIIVERMTTAGYVAHDFPIPDILGGWHHILVSFEDPDTSRLYCDGQEVDWYSSSVSALGFTMCQATTGLEIGGANAAGQFVGQLDDIVIMTGNVDQAGAYSMYNGGLPWAVGSAPTNDILMWLDFEGETGDVDRAFLIPFGTYHNVAPGRDTFFMHVGRLDNPLHVIPDEKETVVITDRHVLTHMPGQECWRRNDHAYEANIVEVLRGERSAQLIETESIYGGYMTGGAFTHDSCIVGKMCCVASLVNVNNTHMRISARWYDMETGACWDFVEGHDDDFANLDLYPKVRCVGAWPYVYIVHSQKTLGQIRAFRWDVRDLQAGWTTHLLGEDGYLGQFDAVARDRTVFIAYHWFGYIDPEQQERGERTCVIRGDFEWSAGSLVQHLEPFRDDVHIVRLEYGIDFDTRLGNSFIAYDTEESEFGTRTIDGFALDNTLTPTANASLLRDITETASTHWDVRLGIVTEQRGNRAWVAWEIVPSKTSAPAYLYRSLNGLWFDINATVYEGHHTWHMGMLSRPWIEAGRVYIEAIIDHTYDYPEHNQFGFEGDPIAELIEP